ncbi:unnamed protein product, partial [Vitis vinifera]|uniref:Uncharacterized protein n=1 Tax=Vitis vinifera TaxID=29760 RepID=D7SXM9_VITVI
MNWDHHMKGSKLDDQMDLETSKYYDRRPYNTVLLKFSAHWIVIVQTIYIKRLSRALIFETFMFVKANYSFAIISEFHLCKRFQVRSG